MEAIPKFKIQEKLNLLRFDDSSPDTKKKQNKKLCNKKMGQGTMGGLWANIKESQFLHTQKWNNGCGGE